MSEQQVTRFEVGKFYRHDSGGVILICGEALTLAKGYVLVAEHSGKGDDLCQVTNAPGSHVGWSEIGEQEGREAFGHGG